mgnify:FL=1
MAFMEQQERLRNSILLAISLFLIACESAPQYYTVLNTDSDLSKERGVYFYNQALFFGSIIQLSSSGDTLEVSEYEYGIKEGVSRKFWPNGLLKFQAHYKKGIYHGEVSQWYQNGMPFTQFNYNNGKESGQQRAWKPDGTYKANYQVRGDRKYGLTGIKNCSNVWEDISE